MRSGGRGKLWQETDRKWPSSPGFRVRAGPVITVREHVLSISLFITAYSRQAEARQSKSMFTHTYTKKNKVRGIEREKERNTQKTCRANAEKDIKEKDKSKNTHTNTIVIVVTALLLYFWYQLLDLFFSQYQVMFEHCVILMATFTQVVVV